MEEGQGQDRRTDNRTLSSGDIIAIADELECRLVRRFYTNIGKGLIALVWKGIVTVIVMLAAYGTIKGGKPPWM